MNLKGQNHPWFGMLRDRHFIALSPEESAYESFWGWQKPTLALAASSLVVGLVLWPIGTLVAVNTVATVYYLLIVAFRFYSIHRSERSANTALKVSHQDLASLQDQDLPTYTILTPLYREPETVAQFLRGMTQLNYPSEKLNVRLILEEDDQATYRAAQAEIERLGNPETIEIVMVPDAQPKTKPKACNYGLKDARGEYVLIYDAEDVPEPDQLKKAVVAFSHLPEDTVCIQA